MRIYKNMLTIFNAINYRTINSQKNTETELVNKYMNLGAIHALFALDVINIAQYELLFQKINALELITMDDLHNINFGGIENEK